MRDLDVFLTFWVQKFSLGTEKHDSSCIWTGILKILRVFLLLFLLLLLRLLLLLLPLLLAKPVDSFANSTMKTTI